MVSLLEFIAAMHEKLIATAMLPIPTILRFVDAVVRVFYVYSLISAFSCPIMVSLPGFIAAKHQKAVTHVFHI
ncbi:hypothetical protein L596_022427 [Steinernema carpocapsae]|uniref:Uncharacterized protein n=1 Tax=Steinernema carpocapsae TaxID=34508 RepID=A0A4U5MMJ4_STECR|nr:hypothetical protein L596_022427 [Steinernema carpocapsae]